MIHLQNVTKVFGTGVTGLADINLEIDKGEFVFLVGKTGSGKTTLLKLLIRETLPTTGDIMIGEWDIVGLPEKSIPLLRKKVGVIFQDLKLLMDRTIGENILLPLQVAGREAQDALNRVGELLEEVGMSEHKEKFPIQLSGGELQRVAIARALALSPEILLADEPTGNLDEATAFDIVDLLSRINSHGTTIVMATHNMDIVKKLHHRVVGLDSGKVVGDTKDKTKSEKHKTQNEDEESKHNDDHEIKKESEKDGEKEKKEDVKTKE